MVAGSSSSSSSSVVWERACCIIAIALLGGGTTRTASSLPVSKQPNNPLSSPSVGGFPKYDFPYEAREPGPAAPDRAPNAFRALKPSDQTSSKNPAPPFTKATTTTTVPSPKKQSTAPPKKQSTAPPKKQSTAPPKKQSTAPPKKQSTAPPKKQSIAKKDILSQAASASPSNVKIQLPPELLESPVVALFATPVVALVALRTNKGRREQIEAAKAKANAKKMAQERRISVAVATAALDRAKVAYAQASEEVAEQLQTRANLDVDGPTVGKVGGALGAGVFAFGLISANYKPPPPQTKVTIKEEKPTKEKKKVDLKPAKANVPEKPSKPEKTQASTAPNTPPPPKPATVLAANNNNVKPTTPTTPAAVVVPSSTTTTTTTKSPRPPPAKTSTTGANQGESLDVVNVGIASLAALVSVRSVLVNAKSSREMQQTAVEIQKVKADIDAALNKARVAAAQAESATNDIEKILKDGSSM